MSATVSIGGTVLCLLASLVICVVFEGVVGIAILCELVSMGKLSCVHWCHQHTCAVCYIGVVGRTVFVCYVLVSSAELRSVL